VLYLTGMKTREGLVHCTDSVSLERYFRQARSGGSTGARDAELT
jgi:hypothetical protein